MLDIRLLGHPLLLHGGKPLPDPPRRTVLDLLVFLLLHRNQPLARDQVAFNLWPDTTESMARANLRRSLHNLLAFLPATTDEGAWMRREGRRLQWNAAAEYTLDLDRFERLYERWKTGAGALPPDQAMQILAEAAALYQGDLCAGLDTEWLVGPRALARLCYAQILEHLGTLYALCGAYEDAQAVAQARIKHDRLGEYAHRLLMWARYGAGDRMGALGHFDLYQALMREELGSNATPEMVALLVAIRDAAAPDDVQRLALVGTETEGLGRAGLDSARPPLAPAGRSAGPVAPAPAQHNLPREFTALVGRAADIDAVIERLEQHPLVTITGFGGMGKTRLALAVAHRLVPECRDGVWWIDLAPLGDPSLVAYELAILFGIRARSSSAVTEALVQALAHQEALLVFDNCEHLIAACADLIQVLLRQCPQVRVLATSTKRLGISGEVVWALPALQFPQPDQDGLQPSSDLLKFSAVQLFVDRVRDMASGAVAGAEDLKAISLICRRLDGMPLAIELAAARTRVLSVQEIAARLEDSLAMLSGGPEADVVRHQALRSTINWSFQLLSGPEQSLLSALAVFKGGCALDAIQAMAKTLEIGVAEPVLDVLSRLVDRSLVVTQPTDFEDTRYTLLDTIRQFGEEKLRADDLYAPLQNRHADHYSALAARARPELTGASAAHWHAVLDLENDNLRAALSWCLDGGPLASGLALGADLWRFWYLRGLFNEGSDWLLRLLDSAATQPATPSLAEVLRGAGVLAKSRNAYDEARRFYEQSLAMFQQLGDDRGVAAVLDHLLHLMQAMDEVEAAEAYAEESLRIKRALGDEPAIAVTLYLLADMESARGRAELACRLFRDSLAIQRRIGSRPYDLAQTLLGLGVALLRLFDLDEAQAMIEEALVLFREQRDHTNVALCMSELGSVALAREDFQQACQFYGDSLAWARRHGHRQLALWQLYNLGLAYREWGKLEATRRFAKEVLELSQLLEDPVRRVRALGLLVDVAVEQADLIAGRVHVREMRRVAEEIEQSVSFGLAFAAAAELAIAERRFGEASGFLLQELAIREELADPSFLLEALDRWVILFANTGAAENALRLLAAVDHRRGSQAIRRQPFYARRMAPVVDAAKAEAGPAQALAAQRHGAGTSLDEAVAFVRGSAEHRAAIA